MADALSELSDSLASMVERTAPSVVRVEARRRYPASGVVWSADGLIVTAHHTVEQDEGIQIGLPQGETVPAVLVARDPATDIAVLRAEAIGLTPIEWSDGAHLKVGQLVVALARPGQTVRATMGIVSAHGSEWRTPAGGRLGRYLLAEVSMLPGFSGGPLVDASGAAAGINSSGLVRGANPTVPSADVRRVVEALVTHGRVRRGYLGVQTQLVPLLAALAERLDQPTGLLIAHVEAESPAAKAGLLQGDVIVAIDDARIQGPDSLQAALSDAAGTQITVRTVRAGEVQELSVGVGERT